MNYYSQDIVTQFCSFDNARYLYRSIIAEYQGAPAVEAYLRANLAESVDHFARVISSELSMSDPLPGITPADQLRCFNQRFILDRTSFIADYIAPSQSTVIDDRADLMPVTRSNYGGTADDLLQSWRSGTGSRLHHRDDTMGGASTSGASTGNGHVPPGQRSNTEGFSVPRGRVDTGTGRQKADRYDPAARYEGTMYARRLNCTGEDYQNIAFGVTDPSADRRLLERSTFRKDESGVENGIPNYERRLYRRSVERDNTETMRVSERDFINRRHDMTSLVNRVNAKNYNKFIINQKPY